MTVSIDVGHISRNDENGYSRILTVRNGNELVLQHTIYADTVDELEVIDSEKSWSDKAQNFGTNEHKYICRAVGGMAVVGMPKDSLNKLYTRSEGFDGSVRFHLVRGL